ncbi:serine O-acetyltransferase [Pantoea coffeiphila]|uniref:serine O-acetyltransferase n=1 Tax=Pantoea coffeiphila TaxID=1465635 RepID=UPI0019604437|nr:serine acetyltransferase [Pantoea coffeiphila]MBM7343812.1 serine O-acetyltransferase [Pantoea coffeiphila]
MTIKEKLKKVTALRITKYFVYGFWNTFIKIFKFLYCIGAFNDGRVALYCDLTIGLRKLKERRVQFPHPIGVVIGKGVSLGYDCRIYQCVTIGSKNKDDGLYPKIGDNVTIFANSVIAGGVCIGSNVTIGASTVVLKDVPDNCIVVGNPARIIQK